MKRRLTVPIALLLLSLAASAFAQAPPTQVVIIADEHGHSRIFFDGSDEGPLFFAVTSDPGPGGQANVLMYDMGGPPALEAGDVFLTEPGSAEISDIIRFNPDDTGNPGFPASFAFYSDPDDKPASLADGSPFPTSFYANTLIFEEQGGPGFNGLLYHPIEGQPGFVGNGYDVQYLFLSDGSFVPEPSPLAALAIGLVCVAGLTVASRRRMRVAG